MNGRRRPTVLLTTEGTYPFVQGGVSTWCDSLVNGLPGIGWRVLAITAGGVRRRPLFDLPDGLSLHHLELWSDRIFRGLVVGRSARPSLPAELAHGLLAEHGDPRSLLDALVWCRTNPRDSASAFRSRSGWERFLSELASLTVDGPTFDLVQAGELYQTLSWVARAASERTDLARQHPVTGRRAVHATAPDAYLVTAAGWAGIPAAIDCRLQPRPLVLAEHGVYVREAYLQSARSPELSACARWASTRLTRGLARLVYTHADVIAPVTMANAHWERALGVDDSRIRTIYNGVLVPQRVAPFPARRRVVSVGRIDPLKDVATMLRTAARVLESDPAVEFVHYGPVPEGNERYNEQIHALHADLRLGDRFRFLGSTDDAYEAFSGSTIAVFTSISEGFPLTVLEAMACGRPVVSTAVGGIPEALSGCGLTARPGDVEGLADALLRLLQDDNLTKRLGERSRIRVRQEFGMAACLRNYRDLFAELTGLAIDAPAEQAFPDADDFGDLRPEAGDHASDAADRPAAFSSRRIDS